MKKIVLSALAVAAFAGAASAQTIEFRWVERHGQASIGPGAVVAPDAANVTGHTNTDATILLYLEARVTGGNAAGISTFGGDVNTNDTFGTGRGSFLGQATTQAGAPAGLLVNAGRSISAYAPSYQGYVDADGNALPAGRGVFNPFRQVANLGDNAQGVLNDTIPDSAGNPASLGLQLPTFNVVQRIFGNVAQGDYTNNNTDGHQFGLGQYIPLFIVRYDVTNLTARTLTFTYNGFITAFSGFVAGQPVEAATVNIAPTYTVTITPAPGAAALLGLGGLVAARRRRA